MSYIILSFYLRNNNHEAQEEKIAGLKKTHNKRETKNNQLWYLSRVGIKKNNKTHLKIPPVSRLIWFCCCFLGIFLIIAFFHSYNDKVFKKWGLLPTVLNFTRSRTKTDTFIHFLRLKQMILTNEYYSNIELFKKKYWMDLSCSSKLEDGFWF